MRTGYYYRLLPDRTVEPLEGLPSTWPSPDERRVDRTDLEGGLWVSTVFLVLDHAHGFETGPPLVFETMVFEGEDYGDLYCKRYSTWEQAQAGHDQIVAALREPGTVDERLARLP